MVDGLVDAPSTKVDGVVDGLVDVLQSTIVTLQGQLEVKDKQLEVRDRQIEQQAQTITQLTEALVAAQQTPRRSTPGRCTSSFFPVKLEPISGARSRNRVRNGAGLVGFLKTELFDK